MGIKERLERHESENGFARIPTPEPLGNETRADVLHVLEEDELHNLRKLKATVDAINANKGEGGPKLLFALEKLVSTAFEDGLLSVETFQKLGFTPAVAKVLVDIAEGKATLIDLDEVWE